MRLWSSLSGETWVYTTETVDVYCVSTYILNYLKEHVARQASIRLLSCPILAGTAWSKGEVDAQKRRFPLPENCWADLVGRSLQSLDMPSRVWEGGRADSKAVAWTLTIRKKHHGWYLQRTDPWTGLKDDGRKIWMPEKPQDVTSWLVFKLLWCEFSGLKRYLVIIICGVCMPCGMICLVFFCFFFERERKTILLLLQVSGHFSIRGKKAHTCFKMETDYFNISPIKFNFCILAAAGFHDLGVTSGVGYCIH